MANNNGGPAFPSHVPEGAGQHGPAYVGMSLRDFFAGQALMGLLAHLEAGGPDHYGAENPCDMKAAWAYEYADAMLAEREKAV